MLNPKKENQKGMLNIWDKQKMSSKFVKLNPNMSVIMLNVKRLNLPTERQRMCD